MSCAFLWPRAYMSAQPLQLCLILWDPMGYSPPGSSVHEDSPGKNMEWVAMPSSRGSSWPRDQTHVSCIPCITGGFFTAESPGKALLWPHRLPNVCTRNLLSLCSSLGSVILTWLYFSSPFPIEKIQKGHLSFPLEKCRCQWENYLSFCIK